MPERARCARASYAGTEADGTGQAQRGPPAAIADHFFRPATLSLLFGTALSS